VSEPATDDRTRAEAVGVKHVGRWLGALALVVGAVALVLASLALGRSNPSPATISVTGEGTTQGTPDTLNFQIGVSTRAPSAAAALEENNARVASLEAVLLRHGVAKKDLQTSGLNIYENTDNQGQLTGFTVSNDVSVTMRHLSGAGAVIDAAAHAAGNGVQLNGVSFSISNDSKLLASARARAVNNAYVQASQIARGAHATLGAIVKITDQENASSPPIYFNPTAKAGSSVPIQPGSESVTVQVQVVYTLHG